MLRIHLDDLCDIDDVFFCHVVDHVIMTESEYEVGAIVGAILMRRPVKDSKETFQCNALF